MEYELANNRKPVNFISQKLKTKLSGISDYPLTVIEAPSGFGKTTAVRWFMETLTEGNSLKYWYTCFGEPITKSWAGFCNRLENFDADTARYLIRMGIPTEDNLADVADAMRRVNGITETYIIVDNFQYMQGGLPELIMDVLASHGNPSLHIVLITQDTDYVSGKKIQNENICNIKSENFLFSPADTDEYLRRNEIALSDSELSSLYAMTEGWAAALNLQKVNYEQTGKFQKTADMDSLIKSVLWNRLNSEQRKFLLRISVFDSFTSEQARIMLDGDDPPEFAENFLDNNAFIRYDSNDKVYVLHALLLDFLRQEFHKLSSSDMDHIWYLAGEAYVARGMNYPALTCFLKVKDYESILHLDFRGDEFTTYLSAGSTDDLKNIAKNCPEEILIAYPKRTLVIAFELFMTGSWEFFGKLCGLIQSIIENRDEYDLSEEDFRIIAGEFARLESFMAFNDIKKMSEKHKEALDLLGGPATLFDWSDAWTFGQPSVLYLFWSRKGGLNKELDLMDECLPHYNELTYGHGTGAEFVMRAEAELMAGNDTPAEALCHRALYVAASKNQDSICYAAELILARVSILRGNSESYNTALDNMNKRLLEGTEPGGQKIVDLAYAFLETVQGSTDVKEWLSNLEQIQKGLYPVAAFYGALIYLNSLLIKREYATVIGLSEPFLKEGRSHNFLLPQVYILIYAAVANLKLEENEKAMESLEKALDMAIPDCVYLPFAEHGVQLEPLLKQCKDRNGVAQIMALTKRQSEGVHTLQSQKSEKPVLTQREREVAELAAQGLTNNQIAKQLFVSVNTVKVLLKRIFAKLDIKSRAQLPGCLD